MPLILELERAYEAARRDPAFAAELSYYLEHYVGRPGPLFLAERRPVPARAPAVVDLCPVTGHGRLSYRQAEALFRPASGGWTLRSTRAR